MPTSRQAQAPTDSTPPHHPSSQLPQSQPPQQPRRRGRGGRGGRRGRAAAAPASRQGHDESAWFALRLHGARQGSFVAVPRDSVFSMPDTLTGGLGATTDIIACPAFDPANPTTSCPLGPRCHFVHVDTAQLRDHPIHVNYAWRSLEDVTYDRYPAGHRLEVAPPNLAVTADVMDSSLVLKTKALSANKRPLTHCAHYYFNRTCNLGSDCRFVHAVFIDPSAKDHQRAPAPVQLGRQLQAHSGPPVSSTAPLTDGHTVHNAQLNPPGVWVPPAAASVFRAPRFELNDGDDDRSSDGSAATPTAPHTDSGRGRWQHRAYDAKPRAASANGAPSPSTSDDKSPSSATTTTLT